MVSSGLLRRVPLVRTDVLEEPGASFIRVTKIGELGTTQAATSNPVRTTQETHYISATESSKLMLCKIWDSHGGDYEKCLLGYENPVRTTQETHCLSATEPSQLMLCKI
jgi:hypothetical protein